MNAYDYDACTDEENKGVVDLLSVCLMGNGWQ